MGKHLILLPTLLIFTCWQRLPTCELIQRDAQHEHVGLGQLRVVTSQNLRRNVPAGWQTSELHIQHAPTKLHWVLRADLRTYAACSAQE